METIMTRYEDVKSITTEEYFAGNQFSADAFKKKYAMNENETYVNSIKRVCDFIASVEKTEELKKYWSERWFDEIYNDWWQPAGSIMQGAGSGRKISLANCFSRDTEFITDKGLKSFEDYSDGDSVMVMNNHGAYSLATIKSFGFQRLYKLTLGRHTLKKDIYCTSDHVWRVLNKNIIIEKRTLDLELDDVIPYIKRKWMPVKETNSRYYCPIGFIHGYTFGDGDYDKATNTSRLHLCGDSKELLHLFKGFSWSIKEQPETITIQYLPSHFKTEIPTLDKYNEEYVLGFLIGYFAADGSVDPSGRAYLASADKDILLKLKKITESIGVYFSDLRLMRDESPFDGNPNHKLYGMHIWKDCLFDSFFTKSNHKNNWDTYKNSLQKDKSKVNWKVISIEETDRTETVWCVQVPEYENFTLSGGVNTHNCTTISLGSQRDDEQWDNLESIFKNTAYTIAKCAAYRQGLGVDFSRLRPRGTEVMNSANKSTGAVHWMEFEDKIGYYVGQCLHPDTKILTDTGYKTIKSIVNEQYSGNVFGKSGKVKVINWFENPNKPIKRLLLEYGDFVDASEDHKVLTYDINLDSHIEKPIKDIVVGDWIICRRQDIADVVVNNVPILPFHYLVSYYNNSNRLNIPEKYPSEITEELAYILGITYGDGCVYNGALEISFSNDWPEILNKFNDCLYSQFGCRIGEYGINVDIGMPYTSQGDCTVITLGKWFVEFFRHIQCLKGKSNSLKFPDPMTLASKSVLDSFFAGLFDSDGYNSMNKRNVCLSLIDYDFLISLKHNLQKYGYIVKLREKKRVGYCSTFNLSFVGKRSLSEIEKMPSVKLKLGNICGKYDRLKTPYRAKSLGLNYNLYNDINGGDPLSDTKYIDYTGSSCDLYIQRVDSILDNSESITYDITVDSDDHLFSAQSIVLKNSGRIPAMLFSIRCSHPDVEEFIQVKSDYTKIQNANISVQCTDAFYRAVDDDADWELRFEIPELKRGDKVFIDVHSIDADTLKDPISGRYYKIATHNRAKEVFVKVVRARKLMELIAKNMHSNAEPGIQNIDVARKYSNSDALYDPTDAYDSRILSTNACCFVIDTQVLTDRGWKTFGEMYDMIKNNERFLAMSYNIIDKKYELKDVVNVWQTRNDLTITLTIEHLDKIYEIECSPDHPILTKNRGYVRADSLVSDDDIMIHE